ncbi:MAG: peptidoglycan bridge formation glycyltransferase FemA/FemB family protein [Anaerolineales bacterium]|uniref:GNAT family N-acetyltransferase n=1 Tax=Candidatus Villigracilis proximus TaxID=3140683 RepID=UPI0031351F73|nr:peptidoglycan bridge formation glycyltransferase FemA/FemB family protein [Anaerolineales bacterium]
MKAQRVDKINSPDLEPQLSFSGLDSWSDFVNEVYDYKVHRFTVTEDSQTLSALTLIEVKHPVFGHYLVTSPFGSYGGFAYKNSAARDLLLDEARRLAEETKVEYAAIRFDEGESTPPENWVQHPAYYTYLLDLPATPDEMLKKFSSDHRNHVRKSLKKGFSVRYGHLDILDDIYEALARSMHELGSPYHTKNYLRSMAQHLGDTLEFAVLYDPQGKIAGGGVFIYQDDTMFNLHANILRYVRSNYAGEFLYWSVIERGIQKGLKTFDLGRSLVGSGNEIFKMKWAPRKKLLAYWHWLAPGHPLPVLNQKNPKFQIAIAVWKRTPAFLVRMMGPHLVRGLA